MRGNGLKLCQGQFRLDIAKNFFTKRVVNPWHRLQRTVVVSPFLKPFKRRVDVTCGNMVDLAVLGKQLDSIILEVFFNLNDSMIWFSMVTLSKITIRTIIDKITRTENVAKKPYERHLKNLYSMIR